MVDDPKQPKPDEFPAKNELQMLVERARGGDANALPKLREYLDSRPEVWRQLGDLAAHVQRAWLGLISGTDLAAAESLARTVEALKAELAGPTPTALERLLVERVAACWLQLQHADHAAARCATAPLNVAKFAVSRQSRVHRNYLTALGALATLRRLLPRAAHPITGATARETTQEALSTSLGGPRSGRINSLFEPGSHSLGLENAPEPESQSLVIFKPSPDEPSVDGPEVEQVLSPGRDSR